MIKVLKFGGTSVGSAQNMKNVAEIIVNENSKITVLSAMSETTNGLVSICEFAKDGKFDNESHNYLKNKYKKCVDELLTKKEASLLKIEEVFTYIENQAKNYKSESEKNILAQGELLTSAIFTIYLKECGYNVELINIPDFMRIDSEGLVDKDFLSENLTRVINNGDKTKIYVTQGFICTNQDGNLDNLGRGGSDYSAALLGEAIDANEVQIWTDIDGIHNNDPRYVDGTHPIHQMSFTQAAELSYFGAKILHPATIQPCKHKSIPVRLKNSMDPNAEGTLITDYKNNDNEKYIAVAAKDGVIAIRICSARMLMAYGFLRRVFEIFEKYKTPIDMITTSEVAVSLTIDNDTFLENIIEELNTFGTVTYEKDNSIVCVVGNILPCEPRLAANILDGVGNIPVKMVSYGASDNSISFTISSKDKIEALRRLNKHFFEQTK